MFRVTVIALLIPMAWGCSKTEPSAAKAAPAAPKSDNLAPAPAEQDEAPAPEQVKLPAGIQPAVGAVATVNGRDLTASSFNRELARLVGSGVRVPPDRVKHIARNILNRQIEQELRNQAIAREQVVLTEAEFEEAYRTYTSRYVDAEGRFDEVRFRASLKRNNLSIDQLKSQVRKERMSKKLVEQLGNVTVTRAEMRTFYANNNNSWTEDESRDVRPILIRCQQNSAPEVLAKCEGKANEVYQQLTEGEDFEMVAAKAKDLPLRSPMHLTHSSSEVKIARAAFALKVGQVHKPIRTRWGYYVIRLIEKNDSRIKSYDELEDEIRKRLEERKYYLEGLRIVRDLRERAKIITRLPY